MTTLDAPKRVATCACGDSFLTASAHLLDLDRSCPPCAKAEQAKRNSADFHILMSAIGPLNRLTEVWGYTERETYEVLELTSRLQRLIQRTIDRVDR